MGPVTPHYIVAIGASAGGLEAINEFFDNFPANDNFSFVIIQHLSPDYKSLLVELITKHTNMQVREAENETRVKPCEVYVIPNNKRLSIRAGKLQLDAKAHSVPNTTIDFFLQSLARDQAQQAIAVILSGTGTDGTKGIAAIKEHGGVVLVQDPMSARFDGMPNSAIASGHSDYILEPELMPEAIYNHIKAKPQLKSYVESKIDDETTLMQILRHLLKITGFDFSYYKRPTLIRRISKRMTHHNIKSIDAYVDLVLNEREEAETLSKEFLVGVTRFFRDDEPFNTLKKQVIPAILSKKNDEDTVKVWIAACSTGQEAYSIAILIDECMQLLRKELRVKIFASDIDKTSVEFAARGRYPLSIAQEMSAERLEHYFRREGEEYVVAPELRKRIVFAHHNIIKDPPYTRNDLVTCRNMLIYMNPVLQKKVLSTLHFALQQGGYLFLGSSENLAAAADKFSEVDRKWKIFQNINSNSTHVLAPPTSSLYPRELRQHIAPKKNQDRLLEALKDIAAEEYGFAIFHVDQFYEVKEAQGNYTRYLSLSEQTLSFNIVKMAPEGLAILLGNLIRKAFRERASFNSKTVKVKRGDETFYTDVVVRPPRNENDPFVTVVLSKAADPGKSNIVEVQLPDDPESNLYLMNLESELKETREDLQTAVEELETSNEELQSSNEELLSANEELQSSNEELQSLNEELHTVNAEHQQKIKELIELNEDLDNYFRTSHIGQIFVDEDLRIRKFNPAVAALINVKNSDIGRPLKDLSTNFKIDTLLGDIDRVKNAHEKYEREIIMKDNRVFLMRIENYIRVDNTPSGYVISFVDVSDQRQLNAIIKAVFNASPSNIVAMKAVRRQQKIVDFTILAANQPALAFYGADETNIAGRSLLATDHSSHIKDIFRKYRQVVETGMPAHFEFCVESKDKEQWYEAVSVKLDDGVVSTFTDITDKRDAEQKVRESFTQLLNAEDQLKKLNQELEGHIQSRTRELAASEERFRLVSKATNDAIRDWQLVDNTVWFNDSFFAQFGYANDDGGNGIAAWLDKIVAEDRPRVYASLQHAINNGEKQWSAEYRFTRANGEVANIFDRGYILHDEYGTPVRVLSSMLDTTLVKEAYAEVERSTETTRFIADSMPQLLVTATDEGKPVYFNTRWEDYTGSTPEPESDSHLAFFHPADRETMAALFSKSLRTGKNFEKEVRIKNREGSYHWFLATGEAKRDAQHKVVLWVTTFTDIHAQKSNEVLLEEKIRERTLELNSSLQQLERANSDLKRSNFDLQQFASVASHDLKEPLRKIMTYSSLLNNGKQDEKNVQKFIGTIDTTALRMFQLIDDLLSFSRLSNESIVHEDVDLDRTIKEIITDLEVSIREKHAKISFSGLPHLHGIPGQIRQLFQNLISNSLKFSRPEEAPQIRIQAEKPANNGFVKIRFSDNGIGFEPKYAEKIFVIFQRLHKKSDYEGTGIGLAIVKKIVSLHGGEIHVSSEPGKGTTFDILLPLGEHASRAGRA